MIARKPKPPKNPRAAENNWRQQEPDKAARSMRQGAVVLSDCQALGVARFVERGRNP